MTNAYQDLCDYFTIDSKKYLLNEFFTDLKAFCTLFLTCLQENRLWREQDEKKQRAESTIEPKSFFKPSKIIFNLIIHFISIISRRQRYGCCIRFNVCSQRCKYAITTKTCSSTTR